MLNDSLVKVFIRNVNESRNYVITHALNIILNVVPYNKTNLFFLFSI